MLFREGELRVRRRDLYTGLGTDRLLAKPTTETERGFWRTRRAGEYTGSIPVVAGEWDANCVASTIHQQRRDGRATRSSPPVRPPF
jgi:hypothetical protein